MPEPTLATVLQAVQRIAHRVQDELGQERQELFERKEKETRVRVDIMARIDRLQDDVTALRDDSLITYTCPERAERISKEDMRSLSEELVTVHSQIRRLQEEVRTLRGEH